MDSQQEYVLRTVAERDIRFIRLWFTDIFGQLKSVMMSSPELESAFEEGAGFDGSSIEGFSRVSESDTLLLPDPSTFQVLPFDADEPELQTARLFCNVVNPDGQPSLADPRHVLRRQVITLTAENQALRMELEALRARLPQAEPADSDY